MKYALVILFSFLFMVADAQTNMELLGSIKYDDAGSDVWGYTSDAGEEFAIMGTYTGVSVVNVTDPTNPIEIEYIPQDTTDWRDIKTYKNYAYVTSEGLEDGILVIDMAGLPASIQHVNLQPVLPNGDIIKSCHNLYIDEFGFAYLAGCKPNSGGVQIFDLTQTPGDMVYVNTVSEVYSHDVYARANKLYSSEINAGVFAIYDVSDKSNIQLTATSSTPYDYTHNTWLSDNSRVLYTTDEKANASVGAYDISDVNNIKKLDEFRPLATIGQGVIPHNVHVHNDWLVISYYTDGCIIVDASRPGNLIEVANYDTYTGSKKGFNGAWGAYPFLPSGNVLIGDIQEGLIILGASYKRAAHIEGKVYDAITNAPINVARVASTELSLEEYTRANGQYKMGTVKSGDYLISASASGYYTKDTIVNLVNGDLSEVDIYLEPQPMLTVKGVVTEEDTGLPLPGASVVIISNGMTFKYNCDAQGNFGNLNTFPGDIEIFAARWGHKYKHIPVLNLDGSEISVDLNIALEQGYEDVFSLDLGWDTSIDGPRGEWIRVKPIGTQPSIAIYINPDNDSDDIGIRAYMTGQSSDLIAGSLKGTTTLTSPFFDVTEMTEPIILLDYWLWTTDDQFLLSGIPLSFTLHNGVDSVIAEEIIIEELGEVKWKSLPHIVISDFIEPTEDLRMSVTISSPKDKHYTEAGIDKFRIIEKSDLDAVSEELNVPSVMVYPNPSKEFFSVDIPEGYRNSNTYVELLSNEGLTLEGYRLADAVVNVRLGAELPAGVYYLRLSTSGKSASVSKVVKI